jgi:DNA polymerase
MMNDCGLKLSQEPECRLCDRLAASRSRIVFPTPCPPGGLLAIGEAPGADEDEVGEGFVGQAGRTLDTLLARYGLKRNRDDGVANIVRCRPPANKRKPDRQEITNCLPWLANFLLEWRPTVLLLVGATATEVFLGPGSLLWQIERSRRSPVLLAKDAHQSLRSAIRKLHTMNGGVYAVPMPHTSGRAWNRKAPNGKAWREIGKEQVELAVECLVVSHAA